MSIWAISDPPSGRAAMNDTCINLWRQFGKYRITFDPAYDPRHVPRDKLDPWYMQIPGRRGCIVPWDGTTLAVEVDGRPVTARRLAESGVCNLLRDGDDGQTFLFDLADFAVVAAIIRPKRRRRLSQEQRAKLVAAGARHRFQSRGTEQFLDPPSPAKESA